MTTEMPMKRLGTSGLVVSRLALGTMTFGDRTDAGEARRIFDEAMAAGVNFIDTADTYAKGASERITGELIRRSEEHTSELQSLMRISYAVFCLKKKTTKKTRNIQIRYNI